MWVYEPAFRTLRALFAAKRDTRTQRGEWLHKAYELMCHPTALRLLLCEQILDGEVRRRIGLHSGELDTDACLLGLTR